MATVGMGRYMSDTATLREGAFRFGGQITYDHLREHYYRDDITFFLCKGLIEEAIGKGFEVIDKKTEETLDWDDQLQEYLERDMPEIVRSLAMERRDGRVLSAFLKNGTKLYFRSFTHDFYGVDYDEFADIKEAIALSRIHNYPTDVPHVFKDKKLETIRELILRRREKVNSGMSYMEPVWDISIALYFVASHIAYHVARAGAGIKAVEQELADGTPVDPLDDDAIDDLLQKLAQFGSANDVLWLPPGVKLSENLLNSAGQVRWAEIFDILLARISIYTGIPMSRLKGLVPGQLEGAEVNEESYFDVLRDLQEQVKSFLRWYVLKITEFYGFGSEEFDIRFNVREEMSEIDTIKIEKEKLDLVDKYVAQGFTRKEAFERANLEPPKGGFREEPQVEPETENMAQEAVINGQ